ncbi:MAG: RecX family transcriptional regulator [Rhodospirillaceae bacterium]
MENAALHYLGRFASSAENLRQVLMRRVVRSARFHDTDPEEGRTFVDDIIERYIRAGLLNDGAFAEARAADLHRRGTPVMGIRYRLKQRGVGEADVERALDALAQDLDGRDTDQAAAWAFARRRRLGPFRGDDPAIRAEYREKDMAALARAGFDYDTARRVADAADPDWSA